MKSHVIIKIHLAEGVLINCFITHCNVVAHCYAVLCCVMLCYARCYDVVMHTGRQHGQQDK